MCRSGARVRDGDAFRVILMKPVNNVPIVDDGAEPPKGAVLLGYLVEVKGNSCKGVRVVQGWDGSSIFIRSGCKTLRFISWFTGKAPKGVTQRPVYTFPDADMPLQTAASAKPARYKEGYEALAAEA